VRQNEQAEKDDGSDAHGLAMHGNRGIVKSAAGLKICRSLKAPAN